MITNNYGIELMIPSQVNKDVIFNEAISKLDGFCNMVIVSFIDSLPLELTIRSLHIISNGIDKNSICYCPSNASGWKLLKPTPNMIFYVKSERNFFCFNGDNWVAV